MQHYGAIYLENELFFIVCFKVVPRQPENFSECGCYFAYGQVPQAKTFKAEFQRGLRSYPCGVMGLLLIKLPSFLGSRRAYGGILGLVKGYQDGSLSPSFSLPLSLSKVLFFP